LKSAASRYANYVIKNRQIADIRDGLLPVQRFVLLSTWDSTKQYRLVKCARIAADTIGKYHPHNADAAYESVVKLTKSYTMTPPVVGQGGFGNLIDIPSAMRYTEAGLSEYGKTFFLPDYMECVPTVSNYDGKDTIPVYLPALLPNILLNGTFGIGYGYSARIPSFSMKSVAKIMKTAMANDGHVSLADCRKLEPVFVNRATWRLTEGYESFLASGIGSMAIEPVCSVRGKEIHVTGMFELNLDKFSAKMRDMPEVKQVSDISGDNCELLIICLRDTDKVVAKVKSELSVTKSLQAHLLINDIGPDFQDDNETLPSTLSAYSMPELIRVWCDYRTKLESAALARKIDKNKSVIARNTLMISAADNVEGLARLLSKGLTAAELEQETSRLVSVSIEDARTILDTPIRRLSSLNADELYAQIELLKNTNQSIDSKLSKIYSHTGDAMSTMFSSMTHGGQK
jgi:DNA gyrase/topoisomerase IV subunit A